MEKLDILSRLKSAFKSGNQDVIDHALEEIKSNGDDTYISPLVEYVHQNLPKENKERIFQLFDDLKHENSVDQLVCELKNEIDPDVLE
jgi:hypothetical protein